jgi:hypothetical protein
VLIEGVLGRDALVPLEDVLDQCLHVGLLAWPARAVVHGAGLRGLLGMSAYQQ